MNCKPNELAMVVRTGTPITGRLLPDTALGITCRTVALRPCGCCWQIDKPVSFILPRAAWIADDYGTLHFAEAGSVHTTEMLSDCLLQPIRGLPTPTAKTIETAIPA